MRIIRMTMAATHSKDRLALFGENGQEIRQVIKRCTYGKWQARSPRKEIQSVREVRRWREESAGETIPTLTVSQIVNALALPKCRTRSVHKRSTHS